MGTLADSTPGMLIRDYLLANTPAGSFTGWVFKFGKLPSEPDQVICFVDQGGPSSFPHLLVDYPGLQVLVRSARAGAGYNSSYTMTRFVRDCILGLQIRPIEFKELTGVTERSYIVPLGYDDQDRHVWSNNFRLMVEPETNAVTHRVSL